MKNLIPSNPGFEGFLYGSVVEVISGGKDFFLDGGGKAWEAGFWDGATYEVIWGKSKGRKGTVTAFNGNNRYTTQNKGPAFSPGDHIVLRKEHQDHATAGWGTDFRGNVRLEIETADLSPNTEGRQCLKLIADGENDLATLLAWFDSLDEGGSAFLPLKGAYRLSFRAKSLVDTGRPLEIKLRRLTRPPILLYEGKTRLTEEWQDYHFGFECDEAGEPGTLELSLAVGGVALLDDVSFVRVDDSAPTAFRGEVVQALRDLQPGIIRFWAGQLGDTLDNQLASPFARRRSGYSRWSMRPLNVGYSLPEFLELCREVGNTEPWYVAPITFSEAEMTSLIEYLAGGPETEYGAKRAAMGQSEPWTEVFPTIHLEFGNEAWNTVFSGGTITKPEVYAARGDTLFQTARRSPYFQAEKFNLILGGQAAWPQRNANIDNNADHHDTLALAPYLMHQADDPARSNDLFAQLLKEALALSEKGGKMHQNKVQLDQSKALSIYEVNLHTDKGNISQAALDLLTPTAGAATATVFHMLNMLSELGIRDQCFYNLASYQHKRSDGKTVKLWGALRSLGTEPKPRPQFLALQLVNKALIGDMVSIESPNRNDRLRAFAFQNENRKALLVFNLNMEQPVYYQLPEESGAATFHTLFYLNPTDHNETEIRVTIETTKTNLTPDQIQKAPPGAMHLWLQQSSVNKAPE
ncbi:MAG: hypothetical protein QNK37_36300 [Acidobacteriota bacterium]|nr:hypothetical protein [Acidobacteriota bacterium]